MRIIKVASSGSAPAGSGTEVQYRVDGTTFGAMSGTAWDDTNRSLTITGATVTTSKPVYDLSQTWNSGGVSFTGWKLNITATASASTSLFADFQLNGATQVSIRKDGLISALIGYSFGASSAGGMFVQSSYTQIRDSSSNVKISVHSSHSYPILIGGVIFGADYFTPQNVIVSEADNILGQRRTTNAQTYRVYGTWTDASNYVRMKLAATSTDVSVVAETAGTGADDIPVNITPAGTGHVVLGGPARVPSYTVAGLPSAATAAAIIYVSNESGGAVLAFSDGTNWRRVTDRAIVS